MATEQRVNLVDLANELVAPSREGRRCIDGRYHDNAMLARPGGDMGYVLGLIAYSNALGWNISEKEAFDLIYEAVSERGGFYFHSDTADEGVWHDSHAHIGCAHIAKAMDPSSAECYGVTAEQTSNLVCYAREQLKTRRNMHMEILEGKHDEAAVLILHSSGVTLKNSSQTDNRSFFVIDRDRDDEFVEWLSNKLMKKIEGFEEHYFRSFLKLQTDATLKLVAGDKKVFHLWENELLQAA